MNVKSKDLHTLLVSAVILSQTAKLLRSLPLLETAVEISPIDISIQVASLATRVECSMGEVIRYNDQFVAALT